MTNRIPVLILSLLMVFVLTSTACNLQQVAPSQATSTSRFTASSTTTGTTASLPAQPTETASSTSTEPVPTASPSATDTSTAVATSEVPTEAPSPTWTTVPSKTPIQAVILPTKTPIPLQSGGSTGPQIVPTKTVAVKILPTKTPTPLPPPKPGKVTSMTASPQVPVIHYSTCSYDGSFTLTENYTVNVTVDGKVLVTVLNKYYFNGNLYKAPTAASLVSDFANAGSISRTWGVKADQGCGTYKVVITTAQPDSSVSTSFTFKLTSP